MANKRNEYPVPKFRNLEEEDRYWQSHSPLIEGYEGKIQKKKQNRASFLSVRLAGEELHRLREIATHFGLGPSTYARQVLVQAMESGLASLPPSFILDFFTQLAQGTTEREELFDKHLKQVEDAYKKYIQLQREATQNIVDLCMSKVADKEREPKEAADEALRR